MSEEKKEKIEETTEESDDNSRRDFLKTTAKAAGAVALVSALGVLSESDAEAKPKPKEGALRANVAQTGVTYRNLKLNLAKDASRKQFGVSGPELGQVLQNEGLIPANIKNLGNAALHVSVSW